MSALTDKYTMRNISYKKFLSQFVSTVQQQQSYSPDSYFACVLEICLLQNTEPIIQHFEGLATTIQGHQLKQCAQESTLAQKLKKIKSQDKF